MKRKFKRKLIEVALPLKEIDDESIKDSSITVGGHPSTFHKWWARRPLAACKAVLFASLIDDPGENLPEKEAQKERKRLFRLIEEIILWKNVDNSYVLNKAKKELKKALGNELPTILDPFCGGGSIPLEAQRLGLPVCASDLNPVAVLITKAMIEIGQTFSNKQKINPVTLGKVDVKKYVGLEGLISDIQYYAEKINSMAEKRIGKLYPKINGEEVIAWVSARTVKCENPACCAEIPLVRSFLLNNKKGQMVRIEPTIDKKTKQVNFEIKKDSKKPHSKTINGRVGAECLLCHQTTKMSTITKYGKNGEIENKLMAIITKGKKGRNYLSPKHDDFNYSKLKKPNSIPDLEILYNSRYMTVPEYGYTKFSDLFTTRQLIAITTFRDLILEMKEIIEHDAINAGFVNDGKSLDENGLGAKAYSEAIICYLAFILDRCVHSWSSFSFWANSFIVPTFSRQALQMIWDFAEANPFGGASGNWMDAIKWITNCLNKSFNSSKPGKVFQLDATKATFSELKNPVICTDPPYYDNIGYADLSDYFYVWLRTILKDIFPTLFSTMLTPKSPELIASAHRFGGDRKKAEKHFLDGLSNWFNILKNIANKEFPITIFYAYKQETKEKIKNEVSFSSTGWEIMLNALISAGLQITGTWPIKTEQPKKLKGKINALASSIVIVCRQREDSSLMASRKDFVSALKKELPDALRNILKTSVSPVDLPQCLIGPGMRIFSQYSNVIEANGNKMSIKNALQIINYELDLIMNERDSEFDPETRFCIAWFKQYGNSSGPFGDAETLTRAMNTSTDALENLSLISAEKGKVKLLDKSEIRFKDPEKLEKSVVWYNTLLTLKTFDEEGEGGVVSLIKKIGVGQSELVKDLAFILFNICDKKKMNKESVACNSLVRSWGSITSKIDVVPVPEGQTRL